MIATEHVRVPSSMWCKLRKPPVYHGRGKVDLSQWWRDQLTLARLPAIGRDVFNAFRSREPAR